jgi:hypothetical protein
MIPWPSHVQRLDRLKAQVLQIKPLDERIDDANRIVFADPVIEASANSESCPRSAPSMNPWLCPLLQSCCTGATFDNRSLLRASGSWTGRLISAVMQTKLRGRSHDRN